MEQRLTELMEQNISLQQQITQLQTQLEQAMRTMPATSSQSNPPPDSIFKVSAKLPPFWTDRPSVWFAQVESQFSISGITTEQTKYDYVVAQLDSRLISEVEDIISNPPAKDRYTKLKEELIKRLSASEEQRVRRLLSDEELGDRKPSQFLRHLRTFAGTTFTDANLLRQLWLRRLPQQLQAILAAQSELSVDKLAELADKIMEVSPGIATPNSPASVFATSAPSTTDEGFQTLSARLEELSVQVAALSVDHRGRNRSRSTNNRSRSATPGTQKFCWYHRTFRTRATKCTQPCSWVQQENPRGGQ